MQSAYEGASELGIVQAAAERHRIRCVREGAAGICGSAACRFALHAGKKGRTMKKLVAYFSATGTTQRQAEKLAKAAGADLYEIKPAQPYTSADLNWNDSSSRTTVECKDAASRPALADTAAPVAEADVIYLGFPIWWYVAPHIVNSFLEAYDFSGKTIVVWATSGGSGLGATVSELKPSAPGATFVEGGMARGAGAIDRIAAMA